MAHHPQYDPPFLDEYIFTERRPEFAHVHGGWARTSKIDKREAFKKDYLEIPGYPAGGRALHIGNHIRKDLLVLPAPPPSAQAIAFEGAIQLVDSEVPSSVVADGGQLYVRTLWQAQRKDDFRIGLILDDGSGHRAVTMFAPGHGYYAPSVWSSEEAVLGHLRVQIPVGFPIGTYTLRLVVLDGPTGLPLGPIDPALASKAPSYLPGEVLLAEGVRIASLDAARTEAESDLQRALEIGNAAGDCEAAWRAWKEATWHVTRSLTWQDEQLPSVHAAMAHCWVARAATASIQEERIAALLVAQRYDPRSSELEALAKPLAEALHRNGDSLAAEGKLDEAYEAYADAVALEPTRAWSRRRAEEIRDRRLGIGDDAEDAPKAAAGVTSEPVEAGPDEAP
jgi:hypothetical protein